MHNLSSLVSGLIAATVLVAACGGTPTVTGVPTLPPVSVPPLPTIPVISIQPDTALEDLLPDTVGGNTLNVTSARGEGVIAQFGNEDPERLRALFQSLGASLDQVSSAFSFNLWPGATASELTGLTLSAIRVEGVAASNTLNAFTDMTKEGIENAHVGPATIGAKQVTAITNPEDPSETVYLYAWNDVVFLGGGTPEHVEEAFSLLP